MRLLFRIIMRELILDTAMQNDIPFQRLASSRVTGTDTDALHTVMAAQLGFDILAFALYAHHG
jgi:putative aminopeptidase FrvX